ncbi:MAG: hypothetical protein WBA74_19980 [Cyclobacteriaceae bacterium]
MKILKILFITAIFSGLSTYLMGQTPSHLINKNWKINEQYIDSALYEADDELYLFLDDGGNLLSDTLMIQSANPKYLQRGFEGDTYILSDQPVYGQNAPKAIEFVIDGELKKWDILYEDINNLVLFKYDTIPLYGEDDLPLEPIIYANEMRLIKVEQ